MGEGSAHDDKIDKVDARCFIQSSVCVVLIDTAR